MHLVWIVSDIVLLVVTERGVNILQAAYSLTTGSILNDKRKLVIILRSAI